MQWRWTGPEAFDGEGTVQITRPIPEAEALNDSGMGSMALGPCHLRTMHTHTPGLPSPNHSVSGNVLFSLYSMH